MEFVDSENIERTSKLIECRNKTPSRINLERDIARALRGNKYVVADPDWLIDMVAEEESKDRKAKLASLLHRHLDLQLSCGECQHIRQEIFQSGAIGGFVCAKTENLAFIASLDRRSDWCPL